MWCDDAAFILSISSGVLKQLLYICMTDTFDKYLGVVLLQFFFFYCFEFIQLAMYIIP